MITHRVLIVTPNFAPANGADSHRVRTTLPFFHEHNWAVEVLAVNPACLAVPQDPWLTEGIPDEIPIHRCNALSLRWSWIPGLGTLDFRAGRAMRRMGDRLLRTHQFDLIYFSTTTFSLATIGTRWKRRFGVPFVVDYQDPWVTDYYREHPQVTPPGGNLKYGIVDRIARYQEPRVIQACSGITAVSPAYPQQLQSRYACAQRIPNLIVPFPGAQRDFNRLADGTTGQTIFNPNDGNEHWMYVGVSGRIMYKTLGALFRAVANWRQREPTRVDRLRLHFIGTSYAPAGTATPVVQPLAEKYGLEDLIHEQTDRIPYSEALCCLRDADALLAPGTDDASYNASKLMPYVLASKPLLGIFHCDSPATQLLERIGGATLVMFDEADGETAIAERIHRAWCQGGGCQTVVPTQSAALEMYTDRGQARLLCDFFETILARDADA